MKGRICFIYMSTIYPWFFAALVAAKPDSSITHSDFLSSSHSRSDLQDVEDMIQVEDLLKTSSDIGSAATHAPMVGESVCILVNLTDLTTQGRLLVLWQLLRLPRDTSAAYCCTLSTQNTKSTLILFITIPVGTSIYCSSVTFWFHFLDPFGSCTRSANQQLHGMYIILYSDTSHLTFWYSSQQLKLLLTLEITAAKILRTI